MVEEVNHVLAALVEQLPASIWQAPPYAWATGAGVQDKFRLSSANANGGFDLEIRRLNDMELHTANLAGGALCAASVVTRAKARRRA